MPTFYCQKTQAEVFLVESGRLYCGVSQRHFHLSGNDEVIVSLLLVQGFYSDFNTTNAFF